MTMQEALLIIEEEGFRGYNLDGETVRENEVGIQHINNEWRVYYTDEKACLTVIKVYKSESEAVENVIECLRVNKRLEDRRKRKRQ